MHAADMTTVKLFESRRVAGNGPAHERGVVRPKRHFVTWNIHAERGTMHLAAYDAANGSRV